MKSKKLILVSTLCVAIFVLVLRLLVQPTRAAGPLFVAPGGADSGDCTNSAAPCATIQYAVGVATAGDEIRVATGTYTSSGDEVVSLSISATLSGGWNGAFTTQNGTSTIDGEGARRGITVNSGITAAVEHLTVQNGFSSVSGGGIDNSGTLTLNNSIVSGNTAPNYPGGGGISSNGLLTLNNSAVSDNTAYSGGGIYNNGTLTLNNSSVSGNTAGDRGGIFNGLDSTLTLNNSTVSGNMATNTTGGGIGTVNGSTLTLNNSTVSGNTAKGEGGGIYNWGGTVTLQNSILAGNTGGNAPDCYSEYNSIGSSGYNLVGDTSGCAFSSSTDDLTNVNPNLGPLIGSPGYHPLLSGSPAIDTIPLGQCMVATDQRGVARPQGSVCDMGAYEYTTPGSATSIWTFNGTPQRTPPFAAFGTSFQALVLDSIGSPVNNAVVTFSAPASGASGAFADSGNATSTAVTDESGIATAAAFTANGLEGSYTVTATVSGIVTPANFLVANFGWYVAAGGSDGNDCQTATTPCATINGVLGKIGFTAGDTVLVASGTYNGTGDEVVLLDKSVRLLGGWNGTFTTQSSISTIDGEGARKGILVNSGITAIVEHFTIQNGNSINSSWGGGIRNEGTLTLNNTALFGNTAKYGGGILNGGTVTLNNSTVSGNTALQSEYSSGGGIHNGGGTVTLNNSTVSDNTATSTRSSGGGIGLDGHGTITLNNSTVSGNQVPGNFGSGGGGIRIWNGTVTLNNSTVSGNSAGTKGGGGIGISGGTVTLHNSIIDENTAGFAPDCYGTIGSSGYNLIGDISDCSFTPITGDVTNIDAKLGPLQNNGGDTETHALLDGSPAIDAGNPAGCVGSTGPLLTDQRGVLRLGRCDIGAYEVFPVRLTLTKAVDNPEPAPGQQINYIITIRNNGTISATNALISDTLPVSITFAGSVTLDPNQPSAILATSALSLPILASNVTITPQTSITLTLPVTVNLVLTETTTPIINTAAVTSAEISTPVTGQVSLVNPGGSNDIYLPILLKN